MKLDPRLHHLSQEQLANLIERYRNSGTKVSQLIQEFNIDIAPSQLASILPPQVHSELYCPYCDEQNLVSSVVRKENISHRAQRPYCIICSHKGEGICQCSNCQKLADIEKRESENKKRSIIREHYTYEVEHPTPQDLTLKDTLLILSLERHSLDESLTYVEPFCDKELFLAPLLDFRKDITTHLYSKDFIKISPESQLNSIVLDTAETQVEAYYPTKVDWDFLPSLNTENKRSYLKELNSLVKRKKWPDSWHTETSAIWQQIAKYECIEYYSYLLEQRGFQLESIGEKTHSAFENLLGQFSASQIFKLTWMAVRDTTDYIVRENIPSYRAKNTFIGSVVRKAEKALAERWDVKPSRRDFNCPQTVVSSTFFNLFLELGDSALDTIPSALDEEN